MNQSLGKKSLKGYAVPKFLRTGFWLLSGAVMSLASCTNPASLSGTLSGVESDTLLVFSSRMNERKMFRTDTVPLVNNRFELQYPDSALTISIVAKPKAPNGALRMTGGEPVLYFPGDKLHVEGSIENFKITGSELYDGLFVYKEISNLQDEQRKLNDAFIKAYQTKNEDEISRVKKELKGVVERIRTAKFEAVKADPTTMAAAYFSTQLRPEDGLEALGLLSEEVKNGPMAAMLLKAQQSYEKSIIRDKARASMQPGKMAPDFNMTTIDGKEVTLSSFHGKYLLVDFWGTWCGWCIKGIPEMKKVYNKYKERIEFLGVSCGDTDKKWRDAVAEYELPWVNVLEGDSKLSARYSVSGFPTKVLLDQEGKIVEIFVGETPALYDKLDQLFK